MKREVKTCRKAGLSVPQPKRSEVGDRLIGPQGIGVPAPGPAPGIRPVEDEMRHPVWMTGGEARRSHGPLGDPEQGEWLLRSDGSDDRFQVLDPCEPRRRRRRSSRSSRSRARRTARGGSGRERKREPVAPDRALPLVLEMGEPVGGLDQERTSPRVRPRELHSVRGAEEMNALSRGLLMAGFPADRDDSSRDRTPKSARTGTGLPWRPPGLRAHRSGRRRTPC